MMKHEPDHLLNNYVEAVAEEKAGTSCTNTSSEVKLHTALFQGEETWLENITLYNLHRPSERGIP